jgi:hypothetical protein
MRLPGIWQSIRWRRITCARNARAWRISDFLSRAQFTGLDLYRFLYQRHGIEYQMAMLLPEVRGRVIVVALQRKARISRNRAASLELLWRI